MWFVNNMSFLYCCPVAGGQSLFCVTGKVELFGSNSSSKTFTWVLVLWGDSQDPYNQYVVSGCSTIDVMALGLMSNGQLDLLTTHPAKVDVLRWARDLQQEP